MVWETIVNFFKAVGTAVINYAKANPIRFGFELTTLAVGVKGYLQGRQMLAKGQDIMANKVAAGGKLPIIYGTRRVGAQIVYMDTANNSSQNLFVVYALSVGEVDEILLRTLEIDGNPLTDPNQFRNGGYLGSDKISSGAGSLCTANQTSGSVDLAGGTFGTNPAAGGYRYVFNAHHGEATQSADPMLRASIGSSWTTSHQLNGVAYIAASFIYDSKGQFSGVPQITVQVRGKKVYDQRKDSTNGGSGSQRIADVSTYEYSDNPAIIFQDFILNNEFGKGLTSSQLNLSTFTTAANKADALVNQPYYNGVAKTFVWSGTSGDNFIVVDPSGSGGLRWWQNKVGEAFYLTASDSTLVLDGTEVQITAVERTHYPGQGVRLLIYFNDTLTSTYSNQTDGSALAKVRRFHCNGYVDGNKTVMENAKELLANMRGIFLYIDGKYELSIEDTGSSTFTITDDHIISDSGISVDYGNKDKKANKVIIEYFNANKKYELDTATVLHDASPEYYSDDGEILEIKAEFPFVTDPYIAYNMGKAILTRSRNQTTMRFLGTPEMYKLNVGDIVTLVYTPLGFTGKFCRVEGIELLPDGLVAVSLIEYFDVYTWEVPPQEDFEELSDIPSAYNVKKPTNITFTDTDASATNRPFLSWDLPTDYPYHQWRVNVVDSSSNQVLNKIVDINNVDLSFIPKANGYVASITALNSLGVESDAETKTFNVGDAPTATDDLQDGSVTNVKIDTLSAAKINTGELNLGQESGMAVRQTKTGYTSTATGFWLGNDGGTPKFNIGTSTNYLKFDGSDLDIAGEISATTGSIGGFTVGETSLTAGSGTSKISLSTADGIHLGANAFADAPFSVNLAGSLTAQSATLSGTIKSNQSFSSGSSTRTVKIDASSNALYTLTAGSDTPTEAPFRIKSDGTVEIFKLDLFLSDGVTKIFDADTGFTNNAFSEIAADLGTAISDYTVPLASNTEAQKITLTSTQNITVKAIKSAYMVGWSPNSSSYAKSRIPTNVRMRLMHSTNADLSSANELATLGSSWTAGVDRIDTGTPTANQYEIEEIVETETGFTFYEWVTLNQSGDAIDDNFDFSISSTASYAGSESGTDHYFFIEIDGTGGSTFGANSTTSTAARSLNISGVSFYISNGDASDTGEGDITAVNAGTNLTGGGTSGSVTLNLASTILGNHTFSNNLIVSGDLTVQGTTTTIDTANLNVEDNNITINYSSGDSSASANGAGITIQDAVSAGNDATLTWNTSNDSFNFSHPVNVTGNIGVTGTVDGRDIATDGSKLDGIESGATTDQTQSEINALGITAIGLSGTPNITVGTINSGAITADDITINGSTISDGADLTLDVGADLTLDVAGGDVRFKGSSGSPNATIGTLSMTDDNFTMASSRTNYDIVFKGNDDGSVITALTLDMSDAGTAIFNHDVKLGDNDIAKFGASDDLQIFHDQPNSINYIKSYTSNELRLESNGNTTIRTNNGDDMAVFTKNGAATLYHDNNPKIATSSTGVTVTGNVTATAFYGDGSNLTGVTSTTINNNADNRIITGSGTANTLNAESGLTYDGSTLSGANIQMTGNINASGVTANNVSGNVLKIDSTTVVDNSRNLTNIGTINSGVITADGLTLGSNEYIQMGGAGEFQIFNDGSNTVLRSSDNFLIQRNTSPRTSIKVTDSSGEVQLSYAGSPKLATTSTGIDVTGTISSGAITANNASIQSRSTSGTNRGVILSFNGEIAQTSSDASWLHLNRYHNGNVVVGYSSTADFDVKNNIKVNSTTVIDSSRNLTNIGTISSGAITSTGAVTLSIDGTDALNFSANSTNDSRGISFNGRTALSADYNDGWLRINNQSEFGNGVYTPSNFRADGNVRGANFSVSTTTVIDSSRNLVNIGTISSGVITATALISDAGNNYSQVKLSGDNGTNGDSYRFTLNNDNTLLLQRSTDNFAANATLALTIDSSQNATFAGNVGIGCSPSAKLNVKHTGDAGLKLETDGDGDSNFIHFKTSAGTSQGYIGNESSTAGTNFTGTLARAFVVGATSSGTATQLLSAGQVRATIDSSGNFGIGCTPTATSNVTTLEVSNATTARILVDSTGTGGRKYGWYSSVDGQFAVFDYDAGAERLRINSSGSVQFSKSSGVEVNGSIRNHTNNYMYVMGDSAGLILSNNAYADCRLRLHDDNTARFETAGSERLRIDANGNIQHGASATTIIDASRNLTNIASINMTGNLVLNGADIVKSGSADLTVDVGGRINLSADDNGEVRLYDGSSLYGQFKDDDDRFSIQGLKEDKDMLFVVNDSGTMTTALKLDAANGGDATFYGNVGIGTSPSHPLEVQTSSGKLSVEALGGSSIRLASSGTMGMNIAEGFGYEFDIDDSEVFRIDYLGRVGIGGSPVGAKLQVQADGISVKLDGTANTTRSIFFRNTTSSNPAQIYSDGSLRLFTEDAGTDIRFHTNSNGTNNERLRIDASGTLSKKFDVGNDVTIGNDGTYGTSGSGRYVTLGFSGTGNGSNRIFAHNTGNDGIYIAAATSRDINFRTNGSSQNAFRISASGTVDMGASNTTVIDASRNLTNIGTVNCSTISNSSTLLIDAGNEIHLDADSGIIRVRDDGGDIGMFRNESLDFTIRSMVGGKDIIFKGNNGSSVIEAMRIDMSAGGSVIATGNVTAYSDKRLKENIETLDSKKALQMRGVSFIKDGVKGSGVIAQEIEEIAPELVLTADDEMGTKSVAYGNLVGYLIETVKDQQKQIDELKQRLDNDS